MKILIITIIFIPLLGFPQTTSDILEMSLEELMNIKIHVGTRTDGHTEFNSLVPVQIIDASSLAETGAVLLGEALRYAVPGFNYYQPSIADGSDHVRPATFRGLQPDQILVLINGQRWQTSALLHVNGTVGRGSSGFDFDAIPLQAIDRIEVLKDGASAQYGSDAIAGIINIVLKETPNSQIEMILGGYSHGDGATKSSDVAVNTKFGRKGQLNIFFNYFDRAHTNYANPDQRPQYFDGDPRNDLPSVQNKVSHRYGLPTENDYHLLSNLILPISKQSRLYALSLLSFRDSYAGGFFRRPRDLRNVRSIYPDGFLPLIAPSNFFYTFSLKLESGYTQSFQKKIGLSVSGNQIDFKVRNSLNTSLGENSPTNFDCGSLFYGQYLATLDLAKTTRFFNRPFNLAFGGEFRLENYKINAGEEASYIHGGIPVLDGPDSGRVAPAGAQVLPGFTPENATNQFRTNSSAYLDIEFKPQNKISLGLAVRLEDYSDFGSATNGKLAARIQPLDFMAIRGTISSGFRAPSLHQSFYTSTTTGFNSGSLFDVGTFGVNQPVSKALGAKDLNPEKSRHASLGLMINNSKTFNASLDFFYVTIKDRIVFSGEFLNDSTLFDADIINILNRYSVNGVRFFTNAVDTRTKGFDFRLRYNMNVFKNYKFTTNFAHHYNMTDIVGSIKTPAILSSYGSVILDTDERNRLTHMQPHHFSQLNLQIHDHRFSTGVRLTRFGGYKGDRYQNYQNLKYSAKILTDIQGRIKLNKYFELSGVINNLFNVYPQKRKPDDLVRTLFPYSLNSPFGFNGRFAALKLAYYI